MMLVDAPRPGGGVFGQRLKDGRMLAVDGQQRGTAFAHARMNTSPPTTSASLLASSRRLPARAAARQGAKPAAPTMAAITVSTSACDAIISIASCACIHLALEGCFA
jgi:hypothetical protein